MCRGSGYLLLLAVDADQPTVQVLAGVPGLEPALGTLTKVIALLLETDPLRRACVARGACGCTRRTERAGYVVVSLLESLGLG